MNKIFDHPLRPFFPEGARLLMLGSFPPDPSRWCMDFFYPNFINDMWRIFGVVFFEDPNRFVVSEQKKFDKSAIEDFLTRKKIALYDSAVKVERLRSNASDKFLKPLKYIDMRFALSSLPECRAIAATGALASSLAASLLNAEPPKRAGERTDVSAFGRKIYFYRMPSSSRAYPMRISQKAQMYRAMFSELKML